jgi:hypothetical protein
VGKGLNIEIAIVIVQAPAVAMVSAQAMRS